MDKLKLTTITKLISLKLENSGKYYPFVPGLNISITIIVRPKQAKKFGAFPFYS
ncbi:hypothetical protein [Pleionea sediminis]|uniref:hypothetical protein n=1 Tax=Pleionea sediminis TaxID=2569479 RepID=UPI0013DDE8EC|nr:hypothetical protein [Pleionea sediminis]